MDDFARVLGTADYSVVCEIYASRERDTLGLSGRMLVDKITGAPAEFAPDLKTPPRYCWTTCGPATC